MPVTSPPLGLRQRRKQTELQKKLFLTGHLPEQLLTHPEIVASWRRSAHEHHLKERQDCAPHGDEYEAQRKWEASPLRPAATHALKQLTHLVNEGKFFASLANRQGQLLWTYACAPLRSMTERSNVIPGGRWDEPSVGTTGISLALALKHPVTVFANEHYLPLFQGLACYSAPLIHPQSGELHGILSLGMSCEQHTPMAEVAITSLAQNIVQQLPRHIPQAELEIHALGQPHVLFRGKPLACRNWPEYSRIS
jgi:transcriptional regulator of acetoin/glycerol metabolism